MLLQDKPVEGKNYKNNKTTFHRNKYRCDYCQEEFSQVVRKSTKEKGGVSDQVICPYCHNFIETW